MRFHSVGLGACVMLGAVALLAGCGGREGGTGSATVVIGTSQDPQTLFPPNVDDVQGREVTELIFQRLADRGASLNTLGDADFVPRLAQRWEWSPDSLRVTFHLDPRARWQDRRPVLAEDVKFGFAVFTDTLVASRSGADLRAVVDSISTTDSLTCTAWFRQRSPEQFDALVTSLYPLPAHLLRGVRRDSLALSPFARNPVGDGPFKLVRWKQQVSLEIAPSATYPGPRPAIDRVIWSFAPDAATLVKQFMAGESDFLESLSVEQVAAALKRPDLRVVPLGSFSYNFLQFNLHDGATTRPHPIFGNRAVRRALTMALDRELLVRSVFDSLGRVNLGPFVRAQWSADTTIAQIGFNRKRAGQLLDSLGWRMGADGVRARDGHPLAFTLLVPTSSTPRQAFAVLIQEQLRLAGVAMKIENVDFGAMYSNLKKHTFDAAMGGLAATPSPAGVKQTWGSDAAHNGGFNYGGYASKVFDAEVDSAVVATAKASAKAHYRAAYQTIVDDAPVIWLYEPPVRAGASARLNLGTVRPDAWWMGIPAWSVAQGTRPSRGAPPAKAP